MVTRPYFIWEGGMHVANNELNAEARNERRKAQRRIDSMRRMMKTADAKTKAELKNEIKGLRSAMRATKATTSGGRRIKSHTAEYRASALRTLRDMNVNLETHVRGGSATRRINTMMQNELNRASSGKFSMYSKDLAKAFYRAGQKYWERDARHGNRNMAIIRGLQADGVKVRNLAEAYEYLVGKSEERLVGALSVLRGARDNPDAYTQAEIDAAWEVINDVGEGLTSPIEGAVASSQTRVTDPIRARKKPRNRR